MHMINKISTAIDEWKTIVGDCWVVTQGDETIVAESATFKTHQQIKAIIQPQSSYEVSECMKVANKYAISIYPISCGKNWGYGSKVPISAEAVILDLGRMNRIIELNENLAYVVIEPGVTQAQLLTFLQEKTEGRLWLDTVASSPNTSLIGNAMERGHGTTPYCDRASHSCNFEVILPTGEIINTGYGIFSNCRTKNIDFFGLGPAVSHLFSQSNFGIVTRMSLMLYPRPESMKIAIFSTNSDSELVSFIDWANQQRLKGILKAGPHISNHFVSLIRMLGKCPDNMASQKGFDNDDIIDALCSKLSISKWSAVFGIWGTKHEVNALQCHIQQSLGKLGKIIIGNQAELLQNSNLSEHRLKDISNFFLQMSGNITGFGLARAYWKKQKQVSKNPSEINLDLDRCGYLSINPSVPFVGLDALEAANLSTEIIIKYGFEPNITAYSTRPRILQFHITLCFDRDNPVEDERALACQAELVARLEEKGLYSFRLNIASMDQMNKADASYLKLLKALKLTFDPNNILALGRYCPD